MTLQTHLVPHGEDYLLVLDEQALQLVNFNVDQPVELSISRDRKLIIQQPDTP